MPSDDENDSGESEVTEPYAVESGEIAYTSDTTVADMIRDALHYLTEKPPKEITRAAMIETARDHLVDLVALIEANPDLMESDTLEELDLPAGWSTSIADESE